MSRPTIEVFKEVIPEKYKGYADITIVLSYKPEDAWKADLLIELLRGLEAFDECNRLSTELAEARAEIERLKNKENEADALLQKCLDLFEEQVERGE